MDTTLAAWALALIMQKAPPARIVAAGHPWNLGETVEQRVERYRGIAEAAADVGKDKTTVALLLAVQKHETEFSRDTDLGPTCYRGRDGKDSRCDYGKAVCGMQVRTDVHTKWKAEELSGDRRACYRAGLELLRGSMKVCAKVGPDHAFDAYAGGQCLDGLSLATAKYRERSLEILGLFEDYKRFVPRAILAP